ncbi:MAG: CaiB/BaiF CoA transferase family protein, partial [Alphaproteobacteria bacterium]
VAAEADVVVQNLRPGVVDKFGVGEADLRALDPRLIYFNISAFSKGGPNGMKPGYDFLMEAFGGLMSVTGEHDRPPSRVGVPAIDFSTALWVTIGILTALRKREATGAGCTVDTSLFETSAVLMSFPISFHLFTGEVPHRWGSGSSGMAPFQAFAAADGDLAVAAGNDRIWRKFTDVLGHPEWAEDSRFVTPAGRWENRGQLIPMIETVMRRRDRAEWAADLEAVGVPAGPVQNIAEMLADPETAASGILAPTPGREDVRLIQNPLSFDGARPPMRRAPPELGDFNDDFSARYGKDGET